MKNKKTLHIIIAALTIALIGCIYLLNKKERQKNNFIRDTTLLLSTLTENVYTSFDENLGDYDYIYSSVKEYIDSFRIYSEYKPIYRSEQFKRHYRRCTNYNLEAEKQLLALINSIQNTHSDEFEFLEKLIEFVFITRMERRKLENYCIINGVGVHVFPFKDTIALGKEYIAHIEYAASFYETIPVMTVNGDTVPTSRDIQVFREKPQKKGKVKHECTITFNQQGYHHVLPFTIEYYVK